MSKGLTLTLAIWGMFMCSSVAQADQVLLKGSSIVLEDCQVLSIRAGQVVFTITGGRRMQHSVAEVGAIIFEGIEELDQAELAMLDEHYEQAMQWFVLALAKAHNDLQRKWIHARLATVHGFMEQYVQASGHAAAVFALEDHTAWKSLAPIGHPGRRNQPSYPEVKEAYDHLQAARVVKSSELVRLVEDMTRKIKPVRDAKFKQWTGARIKAGSTISGIAKSDLEALRVSLLATQEKNQPGAQDGILVFARPAEPPIEIDNGMPNDRLRVDEQPPPSEKPESGRSPARPEMTSNRVDLESMLQAGQFSLALAQCTSRLEKAEGNAAARLLFGQGRALLGLDQFDQAAVAFTRGGLLYPDSPSAGACLLETARIYLDHYDQPVQARRLLALAIVRAEATDDDMIALQARDLLGH